MQQMAGMSCSCHLSRMGRGTWEDLECCSSSCTGIRHYLRSKQSAGSRYDGIRASSRASRCPQDLTSVKRCSGHGYANPSKLARLARLGKGAPIERSITHVRVCTGLYGDSQPWAWSIIDGLVLIHATDTCSCPLPFQSSG